jgi:hypothetical protein
MYNLFVFSFHQRRAAADLENHIKPALPVLPFGAKSMFNSGNFDQSDDKELFQKQSYKDKNSEFSRFCKAIRTIERERIKMRERLQVRIGVTHAYLIFNL